MKLFTKTLLCFVGAIALQSLLTILAITGVTERANLADARRELESEAVLLYDSLHAWKRQLWIALNPATRRSLRRGDAGEPARSLRELALSARMDIAALALRGGELVIAADRQGPAEEELRSRLVHRKEHPYLELMLVGDTLYLVGAAAVAVEAGVPAELFLAKRLDSDFCSQLALNRRSQVGLFLGERYLAGSFADPPRAGVFDPRQVTSSILQRYDVRLERERFNVSWQRIGGLNGSGELFFATFLSNAPYNERLELLDRTVLVISGASALLTIAASLLLSRNITRPIADLHAAMARLHSGALDARVEVRGGREIGRLSGGFNEMVAELERGRRALNESLRQTLALKEYNEKIINSIRAGIAIVDGELLVESANSGFLASFGLQAAVGRPLTGLGVDIMDENLAAAVRAVLESRSTYWTGLKRSARGRLFEIKLYPFAAAASLQGAVAGCVIVVEDVTARAELEEKIMRAEKLSSISVLSAGMAHEINNPLGSILSNAQNLLAEERSPERRVALRWIEQETRRIAAVVAELLNFAPAAGDGTAGADVNAVVEDVIRLLRHSGAHDDRICLDARLAQGLPRASMSRDELSQVALNLLRNSLQAIEGPGRVVVRTAAARDGMIALTVADSGSGIPPGILPRIFDPFFTTKPTGKGTGLGLSVVYGIVTKYSGTIGVRSRPGGGTRIRLGLPSLEGRRT